MPQINLDSADLFELLQFMGLPFAEAGENDLILLPSIDHIGRDPETGALAIDLRGGAEIQLSPEDSAMFMETLRDALKTAHALQLQEQKQKEAGEKIAPALIVVPQIGRA